MKKILSTTIAMITAISSMAQDIKLPEVNHQATSASVMQTLATRHSTREYSNTKLTPQELSNLCWAACGVSRDDQHRTAPTAMNRKEIRLYVFDDSNVYEYDAPANTLRLAAKGDNRKLLAGGKGFSQDFVTEAPVSLLMVIDFEKFGSSDQRAIMMGCVDAGNVSENINLYCESVGLVTVPRATMDTEAISKLLKLTDKQLPIINNPVGHKK